MAWRGNTRQGTSSPLRRDPSSTSPMFQRKYRRVRHPGTPLGGPAGPRPGLQGPREHPRLGPPNPAPANHHCPTAMSSAHAPPSSSHPPHLIHRRPDSTSFVPLPLHLPRSLQCSYGCSAVYATPSAISTEQSLISVQRPASFSSTAATTCSDADTQPGKQAHRNTQAPLRVPLQRPSDKAKPGLTHAE